MKYEDLLKRAKQEKTLKDLTPVFKEFRKEGERIVGKFVSCADVDSTASEGTYKQYLFETDDGLVKFSLGGATDKEVLALMRPGEIFVVDFLKTVKISGGRSVNKFKVQRIESDIEPVGDEKTDVPF